MEDILIVLAEYEVVFWFFAGAILSQIFSKVLAISHVAILLKDVTNQILKLIGTTAEDVAFVKAMKFQALHDAGIDEEQIERIKKIDEQAFNNWKVSLITKMIVGYPRHYRHILGFYDWDGAMKVLNNIYKQEAKYERRNK
tara:strand:+ start:210 stop:632 length:423 start_codon:yes stop_codon:yes gene_type:complete